MSQNPTLARRKAADLLDRILGDDLMMMSEALADVPMDRVPPEDRARAQRLALETLRGLERADRLLDGYLQRTPPLRVMNVLRVATVEMCSGGAAHGVVNAAVEIVGRDKRHSRLRGLVNAVMRKVAADGPDAWGKMRVPRMSDWLREPLIAGYGKDTLEAIEAAHFAGAPLDLTVKSDPQGWAETLDGVVLPTGSVRVSVGQQVTAMPGYKSGDWWVQDTAAALPARILGAQPGEAILDMCAAPGGKTLQLAFAGADVTALDVSEGRMERVRDNLGRTGLKAKIVVQDALEHEGQYDAILLDAPCSATGTIRRHPDLPYAKDGSEFGALMELQAKMLDHAITMLKPGGRLVFCTCSLLPDEGECQIEDVLTRHSDLGVDRGAVLVDGVDPAWTTEEGGLRLRPDYLGELGGMDGFYIAMLRKPA